MQGSLSAGAGSASRSSERRLLLLALVFGLAAAGLIVVYLRQLEARNQAPIPTVPVVVAKEDMAPGTTIAPNMVELRPLPESAVGRDGVSRLDQAVGRVVRYPVARGEQVGNLRLIDAPAVRTLSFQIPAGMRGFTIPVNQTKSPAALMAPGDWVDVLATVEVKGPQAGSLLQGPPNMPFIPWFGDAGEPHGAITLLQNVQVLAVQKAQVEGVPYEPAARGAPPKDGTITYLTLAVTPDQAQMLTLAVERSKTITVALRPFGDDETPELSPFLEPIRLPSSAAPGTAGSVPPQPQPQP